MTTNFREACVRGAGRVHRVPKAHVWQVWMDEVVKMSSGSLQSAQETMSRLLRSIPKGDATDRSQTAWIRETIGGGRSRSRECRHHVSTSCTLGMAVSGAVESLRPLWGSPEPLLDLAFSVPLHRCGAFVANRRSGHPAVWRDQSCTCQARARRSIQACTGTMLSRSATLGMMTDPESRRRWYAELTQALTRCQTATGGQVWRHLLLRDAERVVQEAQCALSEAWWGGRPQDKNLKRTELRSWSVLKVRREMLCLNAVRAWILCQQLVTSIEDGLWITTTPPRARKTLQMWITALRQGLPAPATQKTTAAQEVCTPFHLTRCATAARAWIYFVHGRGHRDDYVGCTCRGGGKKRGLAPRGQQPYLRWAEHIQGAVKCRFFNTLRSLPMYRRLRSDKMGIFSTVWLPIWGLTDVAPDLAPVQRGLPRQTQPTGSVSRAIRGLETLFQVLLRPGWCVPYVLQRTVTRRIRSGYGEVPVPAGVPAARQGSSEAPPRDPARLSSWLVDSLTGESWAAHRHWVGQFQVGRLHMDPTPLSVNEHIALITRLVLHSGQAGSAYPVLRRLTTQQVTELLRFCHACNARWEDQVWRHVQLATRGRHSRVRVCRIRLRNRVGAMCDARAVLHAIATQVVRQEPRVLVRFQAHCGKSLGKTLINEQIWQRRFAAAGQPTCTCHTLAQMIQPRVSALHWEPTADGTHAWCDWLSLLAGDDRTNTGTSALSRTRQALAELGFDPTSALPLHAKTVLGESRMSVVNLVSQEVLRLLTHAPAIQGLARTVSVADWRKTALHVSESWVAAMFPDAHARSNGSQAGFTRQWLMQTWCYRSQIVISTMDKRPANLRLSCPALFWAETLSEIRQYFSPVCLVSERLASVVLLDWHSRIVALCDASMGHQTHVAEGEALTCRSLPKGSHRAPNAVLCCRT